MQTKQPSAPPRARTAIKAAAQTTIRKPALKAPASKEAVKAKAATTTAATKTEALTSDAAPTPKSASRKGAAKEASPVTRESFTLTAADQSLLKKCKRDAISSGRDSTRKSEVIRAALRHFASLSSATQLMELNGLDPVTAGRPKKKN